MSMFLFNRALTARPATAEDDAGIAALTRFESRVHVHLDWKSAEDWVGHQPFFIAERRGRLVGVLACPPAPPDTAWVRVFALQGSLSADDVWQLLWPRACAALKELGVRRAAGLSLDDWIDPLYLGSGFKHTHSVVVLTRLATPAPPVKSPGHIRPAVPAEYETLLAVDTAAFRPPWQISAVIAQKAMSQARSLTVAEVDGHIVGYQLTTPTVNGAHLSRLAVLPAWQGRGLGAALVTEMLEQCRQQGAREISVNTPDSNSRSLALYQRLGFRLNGVGYPVYELPLVDQEKP